jgi:hypothetical protein
MKPYRRFKKKHKLIHIVIVAVAIVMLWRGVTLSYIVGAVIAIAVLYLDDFHLKELE